MEYMDVFEAALGKEYEVKYAGEPEYFLGIRILRERSTSSIWLCQDSYIDKITKRFNLQDCKSTWTPYPTRHLPKHTGQASPQEIFSYQQKVGSINFAATITPADIAKAVSLLSENLQNPSSDHQDAANQVIRYLWTTKYYSIEYSTNHMNARDAFVKSYVDDFNCSGDASFGDDPITRRSSQGYVFSLFGGPIDWKANKQNTVTTSSTEAELLSLSTAAKEMIWWTRFFKTIHFDVQHQPVIHCDNRQTIRLLEMETPKLVTKLRHVDIHQSWLREQVQQGIITVRWIDTNTMPADGMTKILTAQQHRHFMSLLNMKDVESLIRKA